MTIKIIYGANNAQKGRGLGVIIDVFRAFSTACYLFQAGAKEIIPVKEKKDAYHLKKENSQLILIGEENGKKINGFDLGNSPLEIKKTSLNLKNKTLVHLTTCGTRGLKNALNCDQIITGSFVNAAAVIEYIKNENPKTISLICTGTDPKTKNIDEDHLCALYLKNLLQGKKQNFQEVFNYLKTSPFASHFFDPKITSHPEEDFYYCMKLNLFEFVLKLNEKKRLIKIKSYFLRNF